MFGLARVVRAGGGAGSIWDPALHSFVVPVVVVVVVGALATWIPSRRALKIDPVVLLRDALTESDRARSRRSKKCLTGVRRSDDTMRSSLKIFIVSSCIVISCANLS